MRRYYKTFLTCLLSLPCSVSVAQDAPRQDTLEAVTVHAYEAETRPGAAAASISLIDGQALRRFGNQSIVQAVNTAPGVRMEERSPGSYRLSIRGSSLRAPFGVRNVKVYYNDIPITDPGGITFLNMLGYQDFGSLEVIKGPGSSIYGAGNGGTVLIQSPTISPMPALGAEISGGSFGYFQAAGHADFGGETSRNRVQLQHVQSAGYRQQSASRHDAASWVGTYHPAPKTYFNITVLGSYLSYKTPGALTLAEYQADARAARPAAGASPSAAGSKAAISQRSVVIGSTLNQKIGNCWQYKLTAYGLYNNIDNPNIRNYSSSLEPHAGGRTVLTYLRSYQKVAVSWLGWC